MDTDKQHFRKKMTARRNRMTPEEIAEASRSIFEKLMTLDIYKNSEIIFSYGSFRSEADTWTFNRQVLEDKKILALPKVISKAEMVFYEIRHMDDLIKGYMGIMEPEGTCPVITPLEGKSMMLLPGLAFDRDFSRMGYGGGYYDRYLAGHPTAASCCGIAFDFQLLDRIPKEPLDYPVDFIVTESRVLERMDRR